MYKVVYTTLAAKALLKMPRTTVQLIREKIERLASDPYAANLRAKKLQGRPGYRLRVGDWRIIYEIDKDEVVVIIVKIAPRGEVYR